MSKKYWTYVVEGSGAFPMDMLRYDRCSPYLHEDVVWMEGNDHRSAMMVSYYARPSIARWASFGWTVDMIKECKV